MDYTDMKVEDALLKQRDTAVEALVWAFEGRDGWHGKVAEAISIMPESLLACINRR